MIEFRMLVILFHIGPARFEVPIPDPYRMPKPPTLPICPEGSPAFTALTRGARWPETACWVLAGAYGFNWTCMAERTTDPR